MDGEIQPCSDLVAELPDDESSFCDIAQKLENRAKHLETMIDQNRQRGQTICRECFSSICATEILAFDLLILEYLTGSSPAAPILEFVEKCIGQRFSIALADPSDVDACAAHIKGLHDQIQRSLDAIAAKTGEIAAKSATEIVEFMKAQSEKIGAEKAVSAPSEQSNVTVNVEIPTRGGTGGDTATGKEFMEWIRTALKPGAKCVDDATAELRALFGTVVHRLLKVNHLREQLASLRAATVSTQNITFEDCDPEVVYSSPFYRAMENSCKCLMAVQKQVEEQQKLVPGCMRALSVCKEKMERLKAHCADTMNKINEYRQKLETLVQQRREEANALVEELWKPFEALRLAESLDAQYAEWCRSFEHLDEQIEKRLLSVKEQASDMETKEKMSSTVETLRELRAMVSKVSRGWRSNIDMPQADLFFLVAEYYKDEELARMNKNEVDDIVEYHENLQTIIEAMNVANVSAWCEQLQTVSDALARAISEQKEIEAQIKPLMEASFGVKEVAKLKQDLDAIIERNAKLAEQEGVLQSEATDLEEELFQIVQELNVYHEETDDGEDIVLCPCCHKNDRDCIITSCCHPICKSCAEASKEDHKCPVCEKEFTDDCIKPFYWQ